jgi:hypothetical protein
MNSELTWDLFENKDLYLSELKANWRATIENDGGHCPCCSRWGKISAFTLTETHAMALLWLSRAYCDDDGWVNVPELAPSWMLRGKNFSLMAKWGLIEPSSTDDKTKRSDGQWRVTNKGLHFLCGTITIPKKAFIYNNQVEDWSTEEVYFRDCFGKHFDYEEVMSTNFSLHERTRTRPVVW